MGRRLNYGHARKILSEEFKNAGKDFASKLPVQISSVLAENTTILFESKTQAFREALLGCVLAKIVDPNVDITKPYFQQDENSFSGRTLDEKVVNVFLQEHQIPCSKGPYLSSLRRSIRFEPQAAEGRRDKKAFNALLCIINEIQQLNEEDLRRYLRYLLYQFLQLRENSQIQLVQVHRLSLEQYAILINDLLQLPSGGLLPVLFTIAMFQAIQEQFHLDWQIKGQGINVADSASAAAGDVVIYSGEEVFLAVEVTERAIDRSRVVSTFNTKIAPYEVEDYLFFFTTHTPDDEARRTARKYFAQGHDVNFMPVKTWIVSCLATIGVAGRRLFYKTLIKLLDAPSVPASIKLRWNEAVQALLE